MFIGMSRRLFEACRDLASEEEQIAEELEPETQLELFGREEELEQYSRERRSAFVERESDRDPRLRAATCQGFERGRHSTWYQLIEQQPEIISSPATRPPGGRYPGYISCDRQARRFPLSSTEHLIYRIRPGNPDPQTSKTVNLCCALEGPICAPRGGCDSDGSRTPIRRSALCWCQRLRWTRRARSSSMMRAGGSCPSRSPMRSTSTERTCSACALESRGRPVWRPGRRTWNG